MSQLPNHLVWVAVFCALVDFVKLLVELLGRAEDRRIRSDPTQVTAVIASRNGAELLPGTIDELASQIPPERIIVVDDGSTDCTAQVARAKGCCVHRFAQSKGKASAINFAVYRVKTPFTLLLDDDTRMGNASLPTNLLSENACDAVAFHVLPDRRSRNGARGNNFIGKLQRYEYGKSMEIGKRFHDVTQSVSCISGAAGTLPHRRPERTPPRALDRVPGRGPAAHHHPPAPRPAHRVRERAGVDGGALRTGGNGSASASWAGTRASSTSCRTWCGCSWPRGTASASATRWRTTSTPCSSTG
jgi:hypothetical protein